MKKPSRELWLRQVRQARFRFAERLRRDRSSPPTEGSAYVAPGALIAAPKRVDVTRGAGVAVVKFLRAVARQVLDLRQPTTLDFRFTESFYAAGAILLQAELDRIISLAQIPKPVTIKDPRLRQPREVLKQIGIHELTGDRCDIVPRREDVVYWRATKGLDQSGHRLAMLEGVATYVNQTQARQIELSGIWRGVSEAVANTVDHAYKFPRPDGFAGLPDTRWWMFTQLRDGIFTVAVCDLGCGYRATIRHTLPERAIVEINKLLGGYGQNEDAIAIDTAMTYGRSGTRLGERGKGSRDAISVVQRHGDGELMIMSNAGWMTYRYEGGKEVSKTPSALGIDIRGTIVWWKLRLKEANDGNHQRR